LAQAAATAPELLDLIITYSMTGIRKFVAKAVEELLAG
jgi:hypothetical protein